jgi:nucleoside-triphosphatase
MMWMMEDSNKSRHGDRRSVKKNVLLTGHPGCGKTTVLLRLKDRLCRAGLDVGGILCPEIREAGVRVGFRVIDILGREGILAHVSLQGRGNPRVGRYGVNLRDLDVISKEAFSKPADAYIVDEIGPMELRSSVFASEIDGILNSPKPVVAAVHLRTSWGFIGRVKARSDATILAVDSANRDRLPEHLAARILRTPEKTYLNHEPLDSRAP